MGFFKRIKTLWNLSGCFVDKTPGLDEGIFIKKRGEYTIGSTKAEFIFPDRVTEILKNKKDATIDDVITQK